MVFNAQKNPRTKTKTISEVRSDLTKSHQIPPDLIPGLISDHIRSHLFQIFFQGQYPLLRAVLLLRSRQRGLDGRGAQGGTGLPRPPGPRGSGGPGRYRGGGDVTGGYPKRKKTPGRIWKATLIFFGIGSSSVDFISIFLYILFPIFDQCWSISFYFVYFVCYGAGQFGAKDGRCAVRKNVALSSAILVIWPTGSKALVSTIASMQRQVVSHKFIFPSLGKVF